MSRQSARSQLPARTTGSTRPARSTTTTNHARSAGELRLSAPAAGPSLRGLYELPSRQPHGVFVTFVEQVVQQQMQTTDVLVGERRKPTCLQQLGDIANHILGKLRAHGRRHWVVRLAGLGHETTCLLDIVVRT